MPPAPLSGDILAPSAALRPIDATYQPDSAANGLGSDAATAAGQAVWTAHSQVGVGVGGGGGGGGAAAWTVLAVALPEPYALKPHELWPPPPPNSTAAAPLWAFEWGAAGCAAGRDASGCLHAMAEDQPLVLDTPEEAQGKLGLQHSVVVGEQAGWVVLGELAKYVTLSPARFTSINATAAELTMALRGAAGEVVTVLLRKPAAQTLSEVTLRIDSDGVATAAVQRAGHD